MTWYIALYYLLVNLLAFLLFSADKKRAVRNKWRIPERTLLISAALGGGAGALLAMQVCHHKTKKKRFTILVPLSVLLHLLAWLILFRQI
jgi:uncharacterized membrane protein YsdA (DUF1294 family)